MKALSQLVAFSLAIFFSANALAADHCRLDVTIPTVNTETGKISRYAVKTHQVLPMGEGACDQITFMNAYIVAASCGHATALASRNLLNDGLDPLQVAGRATVNIYRISSGVATLILTEKYLCDGSRL